MSFDINPYLKDPNKYVFEIDQISKSILRILGELLKANLKDSSNKLPMIEIFAHTEALLIAGLAQNSAKAFEIAYKSSMWKEANK